MVRPGFIKWNIFLDEKGGPNHAGNFCDAPIMIDTVNDTFEVKLSFDYIGHFSRYIRNGAKRIAFSKYTDQVEMTAFKNVDGSLAFVMLNQNDRVMQVTFDLNGKVACLIITSNSIVTIVI